MYLVVDLVAVGILLADSAVKIVAVAAAAAEIVNFEAKVDVATVSVVGKVFDLSQTWLTNRLDCPNDYQALEEGRKGKPLSYSSK